MSFISNSETRAPNWSEKEKALLAELCIENKDLLDSCHRSVDTNKKKNEVWNVIHRQVNALNPDTNRSLEDVKTKWKNLKSKAKEDYTIHKKEAKRTGGGEPVALGNKTTESIIEVYADSAAFQGISGGIESGAMQHGESGINNECSLSNASQSSTSHPRKVKRSWVVSHQLPSLPHMTGVSGGSNVLQEKGAIAENLLAFEREKLQFQKEKWEIKKVYYAAKTEYYKSITAAAEPKKHLPEISVHDTTHLSYVADLYQL